VLPWEIAVVEVRGPMASHAVGSGRSYAAADLSPASFRIPTAWRAVGPGAAFARVSVTLDGRPQRSKSRSAGSPPPPWCRERIQLQVALRGPVPRPRLHRRPSTESC
jgi:hypothetical protein